MNLISYNEPPDIRAALADLYEPHDLPESHGSDFIVPGHHGLCGVQRKAFPSDFLASIRPADVGGSRFQREINQMQFFPTRLLILEGVPKWDMDGNLKLYKGRYTQRQLWGLESSLTHVHGFQVVWTQCKDHTIEYLRWLPRRMAKTEHGSLLHRPKCANPWLDPHSPERKIDMLSTLPGVSRKRAIAILKHTQGKIPIQATIDFAEVPGIGKKINADIRRFLEEDCHVGND